MVEKKIGPFNVIISELLPENKILFCHPNGVETLKKDILKLEKMKKEIKKLYKKNKK